MVFMV